MKPMSKAGLTNDTEKLDREILRLIKKELNLSFYGKADGEYYKYCVSSANLIPKAPLEMSCLSMAKQLLIENLRNTRKSITNLIDKQIDFIEFL